MSRIESILNGISMLLSYQGKLILVNLVFSAMPSFCMSSLQTPSHIFKQIDRYRKHYICSVCVGGINRKGSCLAYWKPTCRSKAEGALGIINMESQNKALLLKFLDKFYNHADIPWVANMVKVVL
jgi:hypothetical protein